MTSTKANEIKTQAARFFGMLAGLPDGDRVIRAEFDSDGFTITYTTGIGQSSVTGLWGLIDRAGGDDK